MYEHNSADEKIQSFKKAINNISMKRPMKQISEQENIRYSRHIQLSEIGLNGQLRLKESKVQVIGDGGLGCPILLYMAAAGIGNKSQKMT